ncbi:heparinase II/III-family protein, partial [Bacteroides sp. OttesenSCG-928-E20]|nr:heparinase II/III-family protein [Bacteroides sp. OttesenSCG-928-E20]
RIGTSRDLYRLLKSMESEARMNSYTPQHPHHPFTYYPETEFCYMGAGDFFLATKAGYNDESHNHNDVGTFNLYLNNQPLFIDLGVETYTRKTFSGQRYTIWTMQSDFHNLPRINGHQQKNGKQYKGTNVSASAKGKTFTLDMAQAYPAEAGIGKWQRTYKLTAKALQMEDDFAIDNPTTPNVLHFMTWGDVTLPAPGKVQINSHGQSVTLLYDASQFVATTETHRVEDPRINRVWGDEVVRIALTAKEAMARGRYKVKVVR